ncbi:autotransporter domain-containing protein, partial [Gallibacterium genomosp. 2]|uniref:autotransporter domain-containing protein n=1 Tax=Gallibacterium genomosp. 2 TaxID=155517 RepID=UPI00057D2232
QPVEEPVVPAAVNTQSVPTSSEQGELANELTKIQELNESNESNNSTDIVKKRAKRNVEAPEVESLTTDSVDVDQETPAITAQNGTTTLANEAAEVQQDKSNELDSSTDIVKKRAKRNVEAPKVESLTTDSVDVDQETPAITAQNGTTAPASKAAEVKQDESGELNNSTNLDDSTAATNETTEQTSQLTADNNKTVLPASITNDMPIKRLLNADASLIAALPYISSYVGQLHLDYSRRNPNTPLWSQTSNLDYWVNMAYAHNDVKGKAFLNIKQNSQILAIGKDLVSNTDNLIGISATYSKTTSNVKNEINEHLNLNPYVGKVTSEMVSANGYFAHNWNNWYAQAIISAGRVIHDFKNKDKIRYKQNGYILSSEQNIGYRYPFNQDLTLYADLGLQESYHRYSAISVKDINVDAVRESQVNALINLGADYRVANFALSSNIRLIKNLRDFDHLIMNNEWIEDKFVKDSAALSANARYYFTDNISTFINLEYLRSLTKEQKLRRMNYQVGMSIQF